MHGTAHKRYGDPNPREDPRGGGQRRYEKTELLVSNAQFGAYTDVTALWRVMNPSGRLRLFLAFTFEPDNAEDTIFPGGGAGAWLVTGDVWVKGAENKTRLMRANRFLASTPIPTSLDIVTGAPQLRGSVVVPNAPGDGIIPGKLWITAAWEPAPGESNISDEELAKLFQVCDIQIDHGISVSQTGGGG